MAESAFRVAHLGPDAFLDATLGYDDTSMNFAIGNLLDSRFPDVGGVKAWLPKERCLIAVFREDKLM